MDDFKSDPEFNSGIAYLESLRRLMDYFHFAMAQNDYNVASELIIQIYSELYGRMARVKETTMIKECDILEQNIMRLLQHNATNPLHTYQIKSYLNQFFKYLNKCAHDLGLIMPDKDGAKLALQG